jgi:CheY-like chemotaxis protein
MARILVIDDQTAVLATVRTILEYLGHDVVATQRARDGVATARSESFDLVMVDIFMPDMDGIETITLVRQHAPSMPIIVMSGSTVATVNGPAPDFLAMAAKLGGAIRTLRKPFKRAELIAALAASMGESGSASQQRNVS